ncbi:hypothetical protein [Bradyrhizobium sp. CCBAU 51753]|uniref:hypothetical protein n=1 Tax=Bradyrhizobium sp. CCBAU 51753 TaxID=1325100 RepID=UPI00188C7E8C|nr:hypothetical protein [Bradyrhizobium sp. CCBAU 51753]
MKNVSGAQHVSPVEVMLDATAYFHKLARKALDGEKPDLKAAKRYMIKAKKAGKGAAPYISDPKLRELIVADKPMSEKVWANYRSGSNWPPCVTRRD